MANIVSKRFQCGCCLWLATGVTFPFLALAVASYVYHRMTEPGPGVGADIGWGLVMGAAMFNAPVALGWWLFLASAPGRQPPADQK